MPLQVHIRVNWVNWKKSGQSHINNKSFYMHSIIEVKIGISLLCVQYLDKVEQPGFLKPVYATWSTSTGTRIL